MPTSAYKSGVAVGLAAAIVVAVGGSSMETIAAQQRILPIKHKLVKRAAHPQSSTAEQFIFRPASG
jgi:hypothetical protein